MKLVYKTNDLSRAEEIVALLHERNIQASIEGKHTFNLGKFIPGGALSVWVHDNSKIDKASEILSEFYRGEQAPDSVTAKFNPMSLKVIGWFVILWIVVTLVLVIGLSSNAA